MDVLKLLARRGAELAVLDVHVRQDRLARHGYTALEDDADLSGYDLAVVLTDHDDVDYARVAEQVDLVFDTRGIYRRRGIRADNVVSL